MGPSTYSISSLSRRGFLLGAGATAAVAALSACGANERSAQTAGSATPTRGGTLTILASDTDINWDPGRSQGMAVTSLALVHRRLTSWQIIKGKEARVVPDLATDTGKASDGGRTWTFTLKDGLVAEDGSPITSTQIRHGVERTFTASLAGGLGYHKTLLAETSGYTGPYKGKHLKSIETPDDKTIVFHLKAPFGDWPWIVSMPAFAPVPLSDNPTIYTREPVASGPYRVAEYKQGVAATLKRNPKWTPSSDEVRTALPDTIVFSLGQDSPVIAQRLISDSGNDRNAFGAGMVPPAQLPQVTSNPQAKSRLAVGSAGPLQYLAINVERVKDVKVRQAIAYAVDRKAAATALGGEIGAAPATTYITPGIPGRQEYDLYPESTAKAQELLKGKAVGQLVLLVSNDEGTLALAQAVQQALQKVNISVKINPVESETWIEKATQSDGSDYDLTIASWNPDYPSANANLQPLFASSEIGSGGFNLGRYHNAEVDRMLAEAAALSMDEAKEKRANIDRRIAQDVPVVPLVFRRNAFLHGSGVSGFFVDPFPAYPNYLVVGVQK
ncbi:ABC transporter substrate-binding protein [Cutibacterium avidum]|uniref:ABC transporter substrate-binding protein n=1 Tax=Cutibacterium avidum TaxID=33010 RepID=A0A3E2DGK1_9ACTN|nr:ABC transporter substrate-binding protein [Cutibacterium avidum]RFT44527.1 ABC transporter substrate-binding protein [Cutibacterium avidum]TMT51708.1 ABC transporter substrate-binding protein [Cutibacterium avidum]